jgi:hypothetical protein
VPGSPFSLAETAELNQALLRALQSQRTPFTIRDVDVKGIFHEVTLRQAIQDPIERDKGLYDRRVFPQPAGGPDQNALLSVTIRAQLPLLVTGRVVGGRISPESPGAPV